MIKELSNNKSKYFYKKYKKACIKYLTNEYDNSKYSYNGFQFLESFKFSKKFYFNCIPFGL